MRRYQQHIGLSLLSGLLGMGFGATAHAMLRLEPVFLWPDLTQAQFLTAGMAFGLLWTWAQAFAWRLAFNWDLGWGLKNGVLSLIPATLGFLAPWVQRVILPAPHDFPLRAVVILLAAQAILGLTVCVAGGLWRLRRDQALHAMAPRSLALRLGGVAALVYLLSGLWVSQWNNTGDAPHYVMMAHSLAHDRDLDLANNYAQGHWRAFYDRQDFGPQVPAQSDGRVVAEHKPGISVLLAPAYYFLRMPGALAALACLAGLIGGLIFLVGLSIRFDRAQALWGFILFSFCAPWWTHSQIVMAELPGGVCLLLILAAWRGVLPRVWVSIACVILPWLSVRYIPLVAFLALFEANARRREGWRAMAGPLLLTGLSLALGFLFNAWLFGGASPVKAYEQQNMGWSALVKPWMIPRYVSGLMLDQENGWLPTTPVFILGFFGLKSLWQRDRTFFWQTALPAIVYLIPVASFPWWGSAMAPNRYLICLTPFFALWTTEAWRAWGARISFKLLAALSFGWAVFLVILPWFCWSLGTGQNRLLLILGKGLGLSLTPWFPAFMVDDPKSYAWPVVVLVGVLVAYRRMGKPKP